MAMDFVIPESEFLSSDDKRVYALIAAGEPVPAEHADSVTRLAEWGFIVHDPDQGNRPVALNPRDVARRRMDAAIREATARVQWMSQLPAITDELHEHFERAQWRSGGANQYLDDPAVVNARLDDLVGGAEREILAAQPRGPMTQDNVDGAVARDTAALARGVQLRTLYQATVREHPMTAQHARRMSHRPEGKSAEYRTLQEPFRRCIIIDRKVAFISNYLVEGAPAHAAWQINCRATVAFMVEEFEDKWRRANPWQGEMRGRGLTIEQRPASAWVRTTRRQREIMRDLVEGRDQRAVAARLGISARTVSEEIATLKELFDAQSQMQLASKWMLSPDRMVDDSAPEPGASGADTAA